MPATGTKGKRNGKTKNDADIEPENDSKSESNNSDQTVSTPKNKNTSTRDKISINFTPHQTKIDTLFKTAESTDVSDLTTILQNLQTKLDRVASQDFIEKQLSKMITEDLISEKLNELKMDINAKIQEEVKSIYKVLENVKDKVEKVETKTLELEGRIFDAEQAIDELKQKKQDSRSGK